MYPTIALLITIAVCTYLLQRVLLAINEKVRKVNRNLETLIRAAEQQRRALGDVKAATFSLKGSLSEPHWDNCEY